MRIKSSFQHRQSAEALSYYLTSDVMNDFNNINGNATILSCHLYLRMKFVVTQIQRRVNRAERFKVYVDFLLSALLRHHRSTVDYQTVCWN